MQKLRREWSRSGHIWPLRPYFWVPLFAYKKSATIVCTHCRNAVEEKYLGKESKDALKLYKSAAKQPWYLFSGLILIGLFIGYLIVNDQVETSHRKALIGAPREGDVYLVKNTAEPSKYNHDFLKVRAIVGDSLWISPSSYSYRGIVTKLEPEDGFYSVMYAIHKSYLQELEEAGELKNVFRDYGTEAGFYRELQYNEPDTSAIPMQAEDINF